jgi:hypothetical protein
MTQYWQHTDLTAAVGSPPLNGPPLAYVTQDEIGNVITRVLYIGGGDNGGDIYEIRNQGGTWMPCADLSLLLTNYSGDFQGWFQAVGYQTPDGIARVVFLGLDNWVHEFKLQSDGWTVANLSAIAGATQGLFRPKPVGEDYPFLVVAPSPYYTTPDLHARVVYWATDNHIHELSLHLFDATSGWIDSDLNQLAIANGWNAPNAYNQPFGYLSGDSIPRVVYNDIDSSGVQELRLGTSGWAKRLTSLKSSDDGQSGLTQNINRAARQRWQMQQHETATPVTIEQAA